MYRARPFSPTRTDPFLPSSIIRTDGWMASALTKTQNLDHCRPMKIPRSGTEEPYDHSMPKPLQSGKSLADAVRANASTAASLYSAVHACGGQAGLIHLLSRNGIVPMRGGVFPFGHVGMSGPRRRRALPRYAPRSMPAAKNQFGSLS